MSAAAHVVLIGPTWLSCRCVLGVDHSQEEYDALYADDQTNECQHPDSWFSRAVCECDSMHYFCTECGFQMDACRELAGREPS